MTRNHIYFDWTAFHVQFSIYFDNWPVYQPSHVAQLPDTGIIFRQFL